MLIKKKNFQDYLFYLIFKFSQGFKKFWGRVTHKIILSGRLIDYSIGISFLTFKFKFVSEDNTRKKDMVRLHTFQFPNLNNRISAISFKNISRNTQMNSQLKPVNRVSVRKFLFWFFFLCFSFCFPVKKFV